MMLKIETGVPAGLLSTKLCDTLLVGNPELRELLVTPGYVATVGVVWDGRTATVMFDAEPVEETAARNPLAYLDETDPVPPADWEPSYNELVSYEERVDAHMTCERDPAEVMASFRQRRAVAVARLNDDDDGA